MESPKPSPPPETMIVYIDGFNLYHGIHDSYGRSMHWLDVVRLAQSLRSKNKLVIVRYFTAMVLNDPSAQSRQEHYIDALKALNPGRLDVVMGRYQSKLNTCRNCDHTYMHYEEKETDVNIATSILVDASSRKSDMALVVSGDSDIAPAVRAAKKVNPSMFIAAAFPPRRFSNELKTLMPASFVIGDAKIRQAQMPDEFQTVGGRYARPAKWK